MSERKDYHSEPIKKPQIPEVHTWILKEKDKKDLENRIVDTLKTLNSKLTKKEILELFSRVEVSKWLDWLKNELKKEKMLWWKEISEDLLKAILDLIKESKEITQKWIEELKIELKKLNESKFYDIDKNVYLTNKFAWIKKLEDSELGKNIILDITGAGIWLLDSAQAIFKYFLQILIDIVLLPRDIARKINK